MSEIWGLLALPMLASVVLVGIHCQFGLQVLRRNVVFVDLALAQSAALGATVAFMQGHLPGSVGSYAWSLGFAWGAALLLSLIRFAPQRVPHEALVGVLYVTAAAAALLLIERAPQGAEHLKQILTGSILMVSDADVRRVVPLYAVIGGLLWWAGHKGWLARTGMAGWVADLLFYAGFGLVVTSSVAMAGVLLVFSFLIIPALVGLIWSDRPGRQLLVGWLVGAATAVTGMLASYWLDTSPGAAMVCTFAMVLLAALLLKALTDTEGAWRGMVKLSGTAAAAVLLISSLWFAAAPRSDQPLLDALEAIVPTLRRIYLNRQEAEMYADAQAHAQRYAGEMARLSQIEASNMWQGKELDDETIRRISSFQQSYSEMIKGEQFVMKEARARARERWRGTPLALLVIVGAAGLIRRRQPRRKAARLGALPRQII